LTNVFSKGTIILIKTPGQNKTSVTCFVINIKSTRYGWHYIHVHVKMNDVGSVEL